MNKNLIRQQFGPNAEKYVTSSVHAKKSRLEQLVSAVNPKQHWSVLDVATATGHTAFSFAPFVRHVVASDLTPEMLTVARNQAAAGEISNISFVLADAQELPFRKGSFDLVTCRIAPHHFEDIPLFISEARRILRVGGTLAIVDNVTADSSVISKKLSKTEIEEAARLYNRFEKIRDPSHQCALSVSQWETLFRNNGFEINYLGTTDKPMAFKPWVERLNTSDKDGEVLLQMLVDNETPLHSFLRPEARQDDWWFTLTEVTITGVAKPE